METERGFKSLEPLYQRIKVEKEEKFRNLRQPVIYLKEFNNSKLFEVSEKVRELHGKAHGWNPLNKVTNDFVNKQHKIINNNKIIDTDITKTIYKNILSIKISYILYGDLSNYEEILILNYNLKDKKIVIIY